MTLVLFLVGISASNIYVLAFCREVVRIGGWMPIVYVSMAIALAGFRWFGCWLIYTEYRQLSEASSVSVRQALKRLSEDESSPASDVHKGTALRRRSSSYSQACL